MVVPLNAAAQLLVGEGADSGVIAGVAIDSRLLAVLIPEWCLVEIGKEVLVVDIADQRHRFHLRQAVQS